MFNLDQGSVSLPWFLSGETIRPGGDTMSSYPALRPSLQCLAALRLACCSLCELCRRIKTYPNENEIERLAAKSVLLRFQQLMFKGL